MLPPSAHPSFWSASRNAAMKVLSFPVALGKPHQHADAAHPISLLRSRCDWPRNNSAEKCDELAPPHSITSSAVAIIDDGTVRPRSFAVLRLITSSNLVGCSMGKSPGFAPLRILST